MLNKIFSLFDELIFSKSFSEQNWVHQYTDLQKKTDLKCQNVTSFKILNFLTYSLWYLYLVENHRYHSPQSP